MFIMVFVENDLTQFKKAMLRTFKNVLVKKKTYKSYFKIIYIYDY